MSPHIYRRPETDPQVETGRNRHSVLFYESERFLEKSVSEFICTGLLNGEISVLIARKELSLAVQLEISKNGLDGKNLEDRVFFWDAAETVSRLKNGNSISETKFQEVIGKPLMSLRSAKPLRLYGEMVALLWEEGNGEAAVRLEELWNGLNETINFSLLCAYPLQKFKGERHEEVFSRICRCHHDVIPSESFTDKNEVEQRLAVSLLQQKAASSDFQARREQHLKELFSKQHSLLGLAVELGELGQWEFSTEDGLLWGCDNFKKQVGLPDGPGCGMADFLLRVHPDDRSVVTTTFQEVLNHRNASTIEYRVLDDSKVTRRIATRMQSPDQGKLFGYTRAV